MTAAQEPRAGEVLGRTLYEAFWKRNGGNEPAWCDQSSAIRNMWDGIADDAQQAVSRPSESSASVGGEDEAKRFYAVKAAIERAMLDERDGEPCGCIIEAGCQERGYDDPAYAASGFIWQATEAAILAALRTQAPTREGEGLLDELEKIRVKHPSIRLHAALAALSRQHQEGEGHE